MHLYESIPLFELNNTTPIWKRVWFSMHLMSGRAKEISAEIHEYSLNL